MFEQWTKLVTLTFELLTGLKSLANVKMLRCCARPWMVLCLRMSKRLEGRETWHTLQQWDAGQAVSERLAGHILRLEGFESIDPTHPMGGRDGGKDLFAVKDGTKWAGAAYFPMGQKRFPAIKAKFLADLKGVAKNGAQGLAFVTNQHLTKSQRDGFVGLASPIPVDLFHLERIASLLDSPAAYGIRLEFLGIEMTREDQLSFFDWYERDRNQLLLGALYDQNRYLTDLITGGDSYPHTQLPAHFYPDRHYLTGSLQVIGDYPLLDAVVQVKMKYPEKYRATIINGWKKDISIPALYPNGFLPLDPWHVKLEHKGIEMSFIEIHVRARNGWFIQRFKLRDFGGGLYGPTDQFLYQVLGDEFREDTWRLLKEIPDVIFRLRKNPNE